MPEHLFHIVRVNHALCDQVVNRELETPDALGLGTDCPLQAIYGPAEEFGGGVATLHLVGRQASCLNGRATLLHSSSHSHRIVTHDDAVVNIHSEAPGRETRLGPSVQQKTIISETRNPAKQLQVEGLAEPQGMGPSHRQDAQAGSQHKVRSDGKPAQRGDTYITC